MRVSIIGTGYVGLVSGVCLAAKGHDVVCVDIDRSKVDRINRGEPPIHEDGLEALLKAALNKRFRATTDLREAVLATEVETQMGLLHEHRQALVTAAVTGGLDALPGAA